MVKVAALQITPAGPDRTLGRALEMLAEAKRLGAEIACLPEAWTRPNPYTELDKVLDSYTMVTETLQKAAQNLGIWIVAGGLYKDDGPTIECPVISPDGTISASQKKVHLFRTEKQLFKAGDGLTCFEAAEVKTGILVCHDIVFPEAARVLTLRGAEVIFNPSRIQTRGLEPWHLYVKGRALENSPRSRTEHLPTQVRRALHHSRSR